MPRTIIVEDTNNSTATLVGQVTRAAGHVVEVRIPRGPTDMTGFTEDLVDETRTRSKEGLGQFIAEKNDWRRKGRRR